MCLQQENDKEEGLKEASNEKKRAPTRAAKKRTFKKNTSEAKGLKQD